ncbi:MAG: c-type cytochrome [Aliidongia sp.]
MPADPALRAYARQLAAPAWAAHCATCHDPARPGVPNLRDALWLYGFGRVSDLERTILYGIRSGHGKARNITDMPAFGVTGQLTADEIGDVAAYVISLSRRGGEAAAIARGQAIYQGKGQCFDCHGADASGNVDWGSPRLTGGGWLYGGDPTSIYSSIHDGRHGRCPAWIDVLDPVTIRALAVFVQDGVAGAEGAK